jgi:hypothetical protein
VNRLPLDPDGIAALVQQVLEQAIGGWSMGVQGAIAEFTVVDGDPGRVTIQRSGRTVEALTPGGGLRLTITAETTAFTSTATLDAARTVYLTVPRRGLPAPAAGVTVAESDPGALRAENRPDLLADLAVGHAAAAFCIRTGDADLGKQLRSIEGAPWPDALTTVGPTLVSASPHRIVIAPLGRLEVYAAIPPAAGASPEGSHTHLLPALLRTRQELPPGVTLPPDLAPAAAFHAPPGWTPPS